MPLSLVHRSTGQVEGQRLGPYRIETILRHEEEGAGTVYRVRIDAHQRTATSYHAVAEEYYFVIAGHGVAKLDDVEYPLKPGDFLRLPPGCRHSFVTTDEPLDMLDVHTPGCRPDRDTYFVGEAPDGFRATDGSPGRPD